MDRLERRKALLFAVYKGTTLKSDRNKPAFGNILCEFQFYLSYT